MAFVQSYLLKNCEKSAQQIDSCVVADLAQRNAEDIDAVNDLMLSQEGAPGTHKTTRRIVRETGISQRSVGRIIHKDIQQKCLKNRL